MKSKAVLIDKESLLKSKPATFLLGLSSEIAGAYPWFLRLSLFLYRLVQ